MIWPWSNVVGQANHLHMMVVRALHAPLICRARCRSRLVRRDVRFLLAYRGGCGAWPRPAVTLAGGLALLVPCVNTIWEIRHIKEAKISEAADSQGGLCQKKAVPGR